MLRWAQVLLDVNNQSVVGTLTVSGLRTARLTLLVQLFELQVKYGFMLSLKWIPTAENGVTDAISRPSREDIIRIAPAAFRAIWDELSPLNVDLMASTVSVLGSPVSGEALPFFLPYDCAGSVGADALAQDASIAPGTTTPAFGFCFSPPVMSGHMCNNTVVLPPYVKAYWFPLVQVATVKPIEVPPVAAAGCFQLSSPDGGLRNWRHPRWWMVAYEVDFGRMEQ